jgi:hypothetical protein
LIYPARISFTIRFRSLSLYPNGNKPEYSEFLSLFLKLKDSHNLLFNFKCKFKVTKTSGNVELAFSGSTKRFVARGYPKLVPHKISGNIQIENWKISCEV